MTAAVDMTAYVASEGDESLLMFQYRGKEYLVRRGGDPIELLRLAIEFNYKIWALAHPEEAKEWN